MTRANIHDHRTLEAAYPAEAFASDAAENGRAGAEFVRGVRILSAPDAAGDFQFERASRQIGEAAAAAADKGPHLLGLGGGARIAADEPVGVARRTPEANDIVDRPPSEMGGGVLQIALLPALAQISLQELDLGDDVAHSLARIAR